MSFLTPTDALQIDQATTTEGTVTWQSPSNIALIKYWGKRPVQIPANPSISLTLGEALTEMTISYKRKSPEQPWIIFRFEGKEESSFAIRIERFLDSIGSHFPFLKDLELTIDSHNTFPHSTGIASSASSMSALALCLCTIEQRLFGTLTDEDIFYKKASYIARLGSGSACRSVYPTAAVWGDSSVVSGSSDEYAVHYHDIHDIYASMHDDVVIVSSTKKSVSSTAGHALMDGNPFAATRYQQANDNLAALLASMKSGDLERWGDIVEEEAMTLHALMMCSRPSYMLMRPNTIACIDALRAYRAESKVPIYFTLDAGPNVHVLYPDSYSEQAQAFISEVLMPLSEAGVVIRDQVGAGPKQL